jgi:hypothetical protein
MARRQNDFKLNRAAVLAGGLHKPGRIYHGINYEHGMDLAKRNGLDRGIYRAVVRCLFIPV